MSTMTLKMRLNLAFGSVIALLVTVAVFAVYEAHELDGQTREISDGWLPSVNLAGELRYYAARVRTSHYSHVLATDTNEMRSIESQEEERAAAFERGLSQYEPLVSGDKERQHLSDVQAAWRDYRASGKDILALSNSGDQEGARLAMSGESKTHFQRLDTALGVLKEFNQLGASAAATAADDAYTLTRTLMIVATVLGAMGCFGIGYWLSRIVTRQLGGDPAYAARTVQLMAKGELSHPIALNHSGASLLRDMRDMQERLQAFSSAQIDMANEHERGEIDHRIDAAKFPGQFGVMATAVNDLVAAHLGVQMRVIDLAGRYAIGDLSQDMEKLPGKKAAITETMGTVKRNLQSINNDLQTLVAAAAAGDFSARGDEKRYQFAFKEMIEALNTLMKTADAGLTDVGTVLDALARGDLTHRVEKDYAGAFGRLANDANTTVTKLAEIIAGIKTAAETINTAAAEIAAGNNDLAARTETQAASLEETASSMEELTSTVRQNAENSRQARQLSVSAADVAQRGDTVVTEVVATMSEISASSKRIEDIIGTIDGIAFQTNILALNAAVEAARAGDQGRGFAVVASEVRSLAQRAAEAAKEIKTLIASSVKTVDKGSSLVGEAGQTMQEIMGSVRRVTDIMSEITAASDEQASGIELVNTTIVQMDQATQQNAALVEEASAAARAMETQAVQLNASVAAFVLNGVGAQRSNTLSDGHHARRSHVSQPTSGKHHASRTVSPPKRAPSMAAGSHDADWSEF
ncbi:methyl-accepting chemotaxis protein [Pseudomarimonas arenosa]|uniref:MCP four helix bundle domain-containing protein n=1 Tax=Pseudomarimonas arenosa TaxID=2774145 RepID=A0AAW3ZEH4_9GAMM|nr:methyl-accepting chemotaxis protein [Pseudomarimonas arenosa]MBD8524363.1 MCP four helix bundle domain-containing protein [Pseudomarimonas arenosa]